MTYNDVYYQPESLGLTTVGEIEFSSGNWEFDLLVLWKDADNKLYWAEDSGCSCPSPFEFVNELKHLETGTLAEFQAKAEERIAVIDNPVDSRWGPTQDQVKAQLVDIILRVR